MKYEARYKSLLARRMDSEGAVYLSEQIQKAQESESMKYLKASMEEIPEAQTKVFFEQAQRVQVALETKLKEEGMLVGFDLQGSVTNNTHIKVRSDIDLLVLRGEFVTVEHPVPVTYPYQGDPLQDLKDLRSSSIRILKSHFWTADVDTTSSKCIPISGGSLKRKVDVVPCNWYDNAEYREKYDKTYRGIQVLDVDNNRRILNFPFKHNLHLDVKDYETLGRCKPLIRCLKNIVADEEKLNVSSYDLAGLAYNLPMMSYYNLGTFWELQLLKNFYTFSKDLEQNQLAQDSLYVPNKTRKLFGQDGLQIKALKALNVEIAELIAEVEMELRRKMRFPILSGLMMENR